jgi:hypothetical protein
MADGLNAVIAALADEQILPMPEGFRAHAERRSLENLEIQIVRIEDVEPVRRNLSHGVFNDDVERARPARERVSRLLLGFRRGDAIPPVELVKLPRGSTYTYRLFAGAHRFYCAVAAGFTHVPAVVRTDL